MDKRRKRIIAGLAVFMAFMWFCTLVSKSIYASKLPMVSTTRTDSKYIEHIVEAEGIVEAGAKLPVTVLSGLRVKELAVQAGDKVEEGDLLFTVDLEDMKRIMEEQELAASKVQLQIDAIIRNKELAQSQKELEEARAREDYDALARYQDTLVGRAAEDVAQAEEALDKLQAENRAHEGDWQKENGEAKTEEEMDAEWKARQEEEERLRQELQAAAYAEADAKWNRDNIIKDAGRKVEDILQEEDVDATLAVYRTELSAVQEKLAEYKAVVEQEGRITSPMGGMVTDIYVQTGGRVPDTASFLLADDEVPCQFRVPLTKEQKSYVNLNDDVKLELDGRKKIDAKVDYIEENENMPGSYTALLRLPEETGTPGLSGKLTCSKVGEKYPYCVSLLALHAENDRNFVYVVNEREGILGTEYYVEEINVSVVDKNDKLAAVEGALTDESRIIESSTKEIKKGDVVRLNDF
ncbi:MAG: efflux RND transporter periplasmic adaptor subunit [Acetatifactor sp.]|nr:efflux RND transporter periplasmic adaptor subunit [Acetatifactor sp.]